MLLTVSVISGAAWCCTKALQSGRWKVAEKDLFITIVLRKYQVSQMPSSKEPHLAYEP